MLASLIALSACVSLTLGATTSSAADSVSYNYDDLNRLTSVSYNGGQQVISYEYDPAGNMLSRTVTVAEQEPPLLEIASPADGTTIINSVVLVTGTATDAGQGDSGIATVTVNGTRANNDTAVDADTATWSLDAGPSLAPGPNVLTVRATDGSPWINETASTMNVVYLPPVLDANMNGLPDGWESDNSVSDPFGDADFDGVSNIDEYRAGTNPQDPNSAPEGANGVNYVLLRDHFDDGQYADRWSLTAVDPGANLTLLESGTELATTLDIPSVGCSTLRYQSFPSVSATTTVFHGTLQLDGFGQTKVGLQRDNDPDDRLEIVFDNDQAPNVVVRSVNSGVPTETPIIISAALRAVPTDVRVTKNGDQYGIYVNYVNSVQITNSGLGDTALRAYFSFESCSDDGGAVEAKADLVEVLTDTDGDGLADTYEDTNADGLVDIDESDPEIADTDGDGVPDGADNCLLKPNADQRDTNADGYGNFCDADLDNNGVVNAVDLGIFKSVFFSADADADFDGTGAVNAVDLGILKASFFEPPGPSGVRR